MWPRLAETRLSSITPAGLLRRLARAGVADPTMLDDPDEALRQGYYFSPASAHYQAMFEVADDALQLPAGDRSEEHTSELQSLMRISYAVFCLKKKTRHNT